MLNFSKTTLLVAFTLIIFSHNTLANFTKLTNLEVNPGELTASYFIGESNNKNLAVLLHGCVQSGEVLAEQSGLLGLAKTHGFSLLIPQQSQGNNIKGCFNWFSEQDTNKDSGETLSIVSMISMLKQKHSIENVYIVGLSAGGAMASSLLIHYPELFTAGAVVAGIPYPCANNLIKAIACMRAGPSQTEQVLTKEIKDVIEKGKSLPKLSVWTGKADKIVNALNSQRLATSWSEISVPNASPVKTSHQGYQVTQWLDKANQPYVQLIELDDLGHGMAVNAIELSGGKTADFLLAAPISAAKSIVNFWQIN